MWECREEEVDVESKQTGGDTLEDKEPLPRQESADAVHVGDADRDKAAGHSGNTETSERDSHALATFLLGVPEREVVRNTGQETGFGDTEEEAGGHGAREAVDGSLREDNGAPGKHDTGKPFGRRHFLEEEVGLQTAKCDLDQ